VVVEPLLLLVVVVPRVVVLVEAAVVSVSLLLGRVVAGLVAVADELGTGAVEHTGTGVCI
jgi:hypothetical protein